MNKEMICNIHINKTWPLETKAEMQHVKISAFVASGENSNRAST